ncbi:hypothetical protein CPB83DRAFT_896697 [Crepidotus variabilis]|uniref:Uncharacterized protein n=1 Tax=Crepidotus variabilis TaxID=179855 RepID=A0A9P6EAJ5_9AGAR|nr:hypothetical protein CPB83DRAFT_896697 [Crepidotus variabilis]
MAVPTEMTSLNLSGVYALNRSLSDDNVMDEIMRLQGIGWLPRQASRTANITIMVRHFKDESNIEHFDIHQMVSGGLGLPSNVEKRELCWKEAELETPLFGSILTKARRAHVNELDETFLREGWTTDTLDHGVVEILGTSNTEKSGTTWTASQALGIGEIEGLRRYIRAVHFTGPEKEKFQTRVIFDYVGPLNENLL